MNITPHKVTREQQSEPLHQLLLNFGKGLWQRPLVKTHSVSPDISADMRIIKEADSLAMQARVRELTVKQVVTTLRMQHEDSEELIMLQSLESLVLAGEINFSDFVGRAQNLFPRAMEQLDVPLRMKIASLML